MAKNNNYSIKFWENWWECIEGMPDEELGATLRAIFDYAFREIEPHDQNPMEKMFFKMCQPVLDSNRESFENGKRGGRPKKSQPKESAKKGGNNPLKNPPFNPPKNPIENQSENPVKNLTHTHTHTHTSTNTDTHTGADVFDEVGSGDDFTFTYQCISEWEGMTGRFCGDIPIANMDTLERAKDRYSFEDIKAMMEFKRKDWKGTKYERYFHPKTLFSPDKFGAYMNEWEIEKDKAKSPKAMWSDFSDFDTDENMAVPPEGYL